MKPDALNKTSGGPPSLELPTFRRATISAHGIPHGRFLTISAWGHERGGRQAGMGRGAQPPISSTCQPQATPTAKCPPPSPPWSHFPLQRKPRTQENAFNSGTHQPGSQATQPLSRGRNSPGHQNKRQRRQMFKKTKQNRNLICFRENCMLGHTAMIQPGIRTPAYLALGEMIKPLSSPPNRRTLPKCGFSSVGFMVAAVIRFL